MCGILGTINVGLNEDRLDKIAHRGPDDQGIFYHENVCLGQTRLSIQDVSQNAHQPFISSDGQVVLIYNGEIYNHWEIRKTLNLPEERYRSSSDTETIIQGYIEKGEKIFQSLNGIFALAIYDLRKRKLIVVRDRFGVKPLYYTIGQNSFQFSSELKALILDDEALSEKGMANYVRYLWSPGEDTPLKGVKKLLPGTILTIQIADQLEFNSSKLPFTKFNGTRNNLSEEEEIDKLEALLLQAVERQLLSDVPVGYFLSGGVDSSLLVAMASKIQPGKKLQCFTIDTKEFAEKEGFSNDLDYAKIVAQHLNVDLEVVQSEVDIVRDFDKMIWHLDEPQADPAPLNVLNISRRAREMGFKVLIGGAGGDDVFSGYRRHQALKLEKVLNKVPYPVLKAIGSSEKLIRPSSANLRRVKKLFNTFKSRPDERVFEFFSWLPEPKLLNLFSEPFKKAIQEEDRFAYFRYVLSQIPDEPDLLNKMLQLEMSTFLTDHNFNYTDKMGMAVGVEIRVPFLDNDLVDYSYTIPSSLKLKGDTTKYILKKVAERYLPHEVIYRSKAGFGAPVRKWITEDLNALIEDRLAHENLRKDGIFNPEMVWQLIEDNKNGKIDASYPIWSLLAIESWIKQFTTLSSQESK